MRDGLWWLLFYSLVFNHHNQGGENVGITRKNLEVHGATYSGQGRSNKKRGTSSAASKKIARGIFYVLGTGCQWKAVPEKFGSGSTLHRYFQEWEKAKVFSSLWKAGLLKYDKHKKIKWKRQSIDTSTVKSPLGGKKNRAKSDGSWKTRYQAFHNSRCRRSSSVTGIGKSKQAGQ